MLCRPPGCARAEAPDGAAVQRSGRPKLAPLAADRAFRGSGPGEASDEVELGSVGLAREAAVADATEEVDRERLRPVAGARPEVGGTALHPPRRGRVEPPGRQPGVVLVLAEVGHVDGVTQLVGEREGDIIDALVGPDVDLDAPLVGPRATEEP